MSCVDPFHAARIAGSLDTIDKFGGIKNIMEKNADLYDFVYERLDAMNFKILSPKTRGQHGGAISVIIEKAIKQKVMKIMDERCIIVDFRDLNDEKTTVRAGLVAMYNDMEDAEALVQAFKEVKAL
jgi:kynureninase